MPEGAVPLTPEGRMARRSSFSRDYMGKEAAAAFDTEMRAVVRKHIADEIVGGEIYGTIFWGRPI